MTQKVTSSVTVLYSHRRHGRRPSDGLVEFDRIVAPCWLLGRARFDHVVRDERLTRRIRGRKAASRASLTVAITGSAVYFVDGDERTLCAGEALARTPSFDPLLRCADAMFIEVEWDPRGRLGTKTPPAIGPVVLSPETLAAGENLAVLLRMARPDLAGQLADAVQSFFQRLAGDGIRLDVDTALRDLEAAAPPNDQRLCEEIDRVLSHLEDGPRAVTLEDALGYSRRTLQRKTQALCRRYRLEGGAVDDWRTIYNSYRLFIGTIFASAPKITTQRLASMLGYGSTQSLCHAFAKAGLPSPSACRRASGGEGQALDRSEGEVSTTRPR